MNLRDVGEFGLIERIRARVGAPRGELRVGIGDDAAVIDAPRTGPILVTTDAYVEGVHFRRDFSSPRDIGWKAAAGALSDIAAMGGRARHLFLALGAPPETPLDVVDGLLDGLLELANRYDVVLAGGDTVSSPDRILVSLTAIGETVAASEASAGSAGGTEGTASAAPILRSGARAGDVLFVTGSLGGSLAGLTLLLEARASGDAPSVLDALARHRAPEPRLREGALLATRFHPTAMIDISDGLASDARHLAVASGVDLRIDLAKIPVAACAADVAARLGRDAKQMALASGEEYELLFTASPDEADEIASALLAETGTRVTLIGEAIARGPAGADARATDAAAVMLRDPLGNETPLAPSGWRHF
ncbi:MAG: thiamine-phosphate kinase [bacterium]